MPRDDMHGFDDDIDEPWGLYDGQCLACELYGPVDDLGLCQECGTKLERDLIRQRDWDYSVAAFGLSAADREKLRRQVIQQYGRKQELIAPSKTLRRGRSR